MSREMHDEYRLMDWFLDAVDDAVVEIEDPEQKALARRCLCGGHRGRKPQWLAKLRLVVTEKMVAKGASEPFLGRMMQLVPSAINLQKKILARRSERNETEKYNTGPANR